MNSLFGLLLQLPLFILLMCMPAPAPGHHTELIVLLSAYFISTCLYILGLYIWLFKGRVKMFYFEQKSYLTVFHKKGISCKVYTTQSPTNDEKFIQSFVDDLINVDKFENPVIINLTKLSRKLKFRWNNKEKRS